MFESLRDELLGYCFDLIGTIRGDNYEIELY